MADDKPTEVEIPLDHLTWAEIVKLLDEYGVPAEQRDAILDSIGCPCCTPGFAIAVGPHKTPKF
jgi:hypothetical protein